MQRNQILFPKLRQPWHLKTCPVTNDGDFAPKNPTACSPFKGLIRAGQCLRVGVSPDQGGGAGAPACAWGSRDNDELLRWRDVVQETLKFETEGRQLFVLICFFSFHPCDYLPTFYFLKE